MAIEKQLVVDRIEIDRYALLSVRLRYEITEDTEVLMHRYHRITLEPGDNLSQKLQQINTHLTSLNIPTIPIGQSNKIGQIANLLWTPAVIAAYLARKQDIENA